MVDTWLNVHVSQGVKASTIRKKIYKKKNDAIVVATTPNQKTLQTLTIVEFFLMVPQYQ